MKALLVQDCRSWLPVVALSMLLFSLTLTADSVKAASDAPLLGSEFSLDLLTSGDAMLQTPGGELLFRRFAFGALPPDAPSAAEITVSADFDVVENRATLLFTIDGPARLLEPGESYSMVIAYDIATRLPKMALAAALLDIGGATIGTSGDGSVHVGARLGWQDEPLLESSVWDAPPDPPKLVDDGFLSRPARRVGNETRVVMDGGSAPGSAALFTDFTQRWTLAEVPEPTSLALSCSMALFLLIGMRRAVGRDVCKPLHNNTLRSRQWQPEA